MRFLTENAHRAARVGVLAVRWRTGPLFVYLFDLVPAYLQVHDGPVVVGVGPGEPVLRVGDRAQRVPPVRDGLDAELLTAHAGPVGVAPAGRDALGLIAAAAVLPLLPMLGDEMPVYLGVPAAV